MRTQLLGAILTGICALTAAGDLPVAPRNPTGGADLETRDVIVKLEEFQTAVAPLLSSPNYKIDETVQLTGPYCVFAVECPHGTYQVVGFYSLYRLCHEIDVIETYRKTAEGGEVWDGAMATVKNTVDGAKNLVFHPGQSAAAIARAPARMARGITGFFQKEEDPAAKTRTQGVRGMAAKEIRLAAFELGLDAYSDNPNVQALLQGIGKKRKAGALLLDVGKYAAGVGGIAGDLARASLTPGGQSVDIEKDIAENDPKELYRILGKRYGEFLPPAAAAKAEALLKNRNYSPREEAYLCWTLGQMKAVRAPEKVLAMLSAVGSPEEAILANAQVELLFALHRSKRPAASWISLPSGIAAYLDIQGRAVVALPYDLVQMDDPKVGRIPGIVAAAKEQGAKTFEAWVAGYATPEGEALAKELGVELKTGLIAIMQQQ